VAFALAALAGALACRGRSSAPADSGAKDVAVPEPSATLGVGDASSAVDAAPTLDASTVGDASVTAVPTLGDAGPAACKLLYGPQEQPFRGTAFLAASGNRLEVVANDSGRTRGFGLPIPPTLAPVAPTRVLSFEPMSFPPCEPAGRFVYCPGRGGAIRRIDGMREREVAKGRPATRIAAAPIGGEGHSVVAYLAERSTTEGMMLQAFVVLDEGEPVRLSDDGSGATQLSLVPAGDKVVALYLDARTAMTPMHARELSLGKDGKIELGNDAVLTVGGPAERGVTLASGRLKGQTFALVPMPQDVTSFGMTTIAVPSPPKDDVPVKVSAYANGLDPAPLAATRSETLDRMYVARVVPEGAERDAPRALQLGHLVADGTFTSHGLVARGARITDVAIALDAAKAVWILYGDAAHTWLTRFSCP
jgi:hypothetical protein